MPSDTNGAVSNHDWTAFVAYPDAVPLKIHDARRLK